MYVSTLDSARNGICNAAPSRIDDRQRAEDYVESDVLTSRAPGHKSPLLHSYST